MARTIKTVNSVEFDTMVGGEHVTIAFTRTTKMALENYGADADGNRGVLMWMVDSDEASDIRVTNENGEEIEPNSEEVDAAIEVYMENHEAEANFGIRREL
jgi:hypothetical protein